MSISLLVIGGVALVVVLALFLAVLLRSRKVNLTETGEDQPEWMRETPPPETIAAAKENHGEGERLAAPFAEQIEDILHAMLEKDPYLKQFDVDLGTGPDGGLEIWVNGEVYKEVDALPDKRLKQAFHKAVDQWNKP